MRYSKQERGKIQVGKRGKEEKKKICFKISALRRLKRGGGKGREEKGGRLLRQFRCLFRSSSPREGIEGNFGKKKEKKKEG